MGAVQQRCCPADAARQHSADHTRTATGTPRAPRRRDDGHTLCAGWSPRHIRQSAAHRGRRLVLRSGRGLAARTARDGRTAWRTDPRSLRVAGRQDGRHGCVHARLGHAHRLRRARRARSVCSATPSVAAARATCTSSTCRTGTSALRRHIRPRARGCAVLRSGHDPPRSRYPLAAHSGRATASRGAAGGSPHACSECRETWRPIGVRDVLERT